MAGQSVALPHAGNAGNIFNNGWGSEYVVFESDGNPVTIQVNASANEIHCWFSVSDFKIMQLDPGMRELDRVKAFVLQAGTLPYADQQKKPNADITASSDEEAMTMAASLLTALRAYYESNALAEGVTSAVNYTDSIFNHAEPTSNEGWTITGRMNNPFNDQPWTNADGGNVHSYFDGGDWGNTSWTTTMEQTITIPSGRYYLTAKGRAAAPVTLTLSASGQSITIPCYNDQGNVFDRGWGDYSVEFLTDGATDITVSASANEIHSWFSISDFRLMRIGSRWQLGDVDHNGYVNTNDVTALAEILLGLRAPNEEANMDGTGGITLHDATILINYLLSQPQP